MKRHQGSIVLAALGLAILMAGCWGSSKSTSVTVGGGGTVLSTATAVGIDKCYNCHANTAVGGVGIFDAWAAGRHGNDNNAFDAWDNLIQSVSPPYHGDYPPANPIEQVQCGPCHDPNEDSLNLALYLGPGSSTTPRWVVGCEGCHGGGSLHYGVGPIGGPKLGEYARPATPGQSSQYNTCTACHVAVNHSTDFYRNIADTHFDNAAGAFNDVTIEGYIILKASDTACVDCHNPHSASMTVNASVGSPNLQWKNSAHGDFNGAAWRHYPWTIASRQACQRCHTTTGLVNYLTDPANYDQTKNVYSWKADATDNRAELLYCWGCHTNYYGGLRDPGPITASYSGVSPQPVYPDVKGSNICMACHTGRENGDSIKGSTGSFDNLSFINSHYLTAGATLFSESGYEYAGPDYGNLSYFKHDKIGTVDAAGTGSNGPCVGCHMSSTLNPADPTQGKHKFLNVGLNDAGTDNVITTPVCAVCHVSPYTMTITELDEAEEEALAGLAVLDNVLRARGYFFANSHPYFFKTPDNTASTNAVKDWSKRFDGSAGDNTVGMNNMGAAFNYNLFEHDPGFFSHNNHYAKVLIYDSIDWLDNNALDNSVQTYINADITDPAVKADALLFFGESGRPPRL